MSELPPEPAAAATSEGPPLKILFVDDEPDLAPLIRQKFRRRVRSGELELDFAGDGQEALEKVLADPDIEVIVTDLNMPRMDGLTLLGRLDELDRRHKAVVVTAYGDMENIRTAMNKGAFDFLTKPIDMDDLQITLQQARRAVEREREADRVRRALGTYLSTEVAQAILANPGSLSLDGEMREVSVLMSDLSGFSQISETLPPEAVVRLLNVYLSAMTDVVDAFDGTIDEFIGDAVLAIFGAPIEQPDHADRAVACALAMQAKMDEVNEEMASLGLPRLEMTAAVNSGEVVVGSIGSEKRAKYGVVGSPVNLTARIQSQAAPGEVLISEATRQSVAAGLTLAETREAGLKGFAENVPLHSVRAISGEYAAALDDDEPHYRQLAEPLAFTFVHLDGKRVDSETIPGEIVRVSERGAEALVDGAVPARSDLRLDLTVPGAEPTQVYAKTLTSEPEGGRTRVRLRFTAVPESVGAALNELAPESA
ncbi:MAG TPA: adenylate/guanylate cyclase domain-containing response regulator [Rhodothermales bacterium]|nr:adenylate/guanylate cyclase domain-containing response regulator [Rhodothermales bacterium]